MQSKLSTYYHHPKVAKRIADGVPNPPADEDLPEAIAPNEAYDFNVDAVDGISQLRKDIRDAEYATDPIEEWSHILGRFLSNRNTKFTDEIVTFNMGAATDCVNMGTDRCQVSAEKCFAARNERDWPHPIHFRRKQAIIWDHIDPVTFAKAFKRHADRKNNPISIIRFNESSDFETRHDVLRVNEIARRLPDFHVFTYSASSYLDWSDATEFTVNASDPNAEYGDRHYRTVQDASEIPDDGIHCPYDRDDVEGVKCGDCMACITDAGATDIYVEEFEGSNK